MTRLPLTGPEPDDEIVAQVFEAFAREGREPIALYRVLAHSPALLRAYAGLARGLRYEAALPRALRELVILRTAQLTGSDYEWSHHVGMARHAGVRDEQIRALARWRDDDAFDARERAALRCAEEMDALALGEEAFAELRAAFAPGEVVELILLTAFYQAVARMLQAFDLDVEPAYEAYLRDFPR
jgi:4-carboxymuconolactone decarboxylase